MKTDERTKVEFERESSHQGLSQYSNQFRDFKKFANEQFIVPWQMDVEKKSKILVE